MKKLFSILASLFIILSGMNVSLSAHYCHNHLVAGKVSFANEHASCGMESKQAHNLGCTDTFSTDCCKDVNSQLRVDSNFGGSPSSVVAAAQTIQLFMGTAVTHLSSLQTNTQTSQCADTSPPGLFAATDVSLPRICVFRI